MLETLSSELLRAADRGSGGGGGGEGGGLYASREFEGYAAAVARSFRGAVAAEQTRLLLSFLLV